MERVRDTNAMIAGMTPSLDPETYVFVQSDDPSHADQALAKFSEAEGMSLIVTQAQASAFGLAVESPMSRITLNVYSDLEGVGLTAAVASALTEANIACNMVAAFHHDHAFVPHSKAAQAMTVLTQLSDAHK